MNATLHSTADFDSYNRTAGVSMPLNVYTKRTHFFTPPPPPCLLSNITLLWTEIKIKHWLNWMTRLCITVHMGLCIYFQFSLFLNVWQILNCYTKRITEQGRWVKYRIKHHYMVCCANGPLAKYGSLSSQYLTQTVVHIIKSQVICYLEKPASITI